MNNKNRSINIRLSKSALAKSALAKSTQGFMLIETLVVMLILSIGLFGLAALQIASLKVSNGSNQRVQATFLAYDMMDRMRTNSDSDKAEDYNVLMATAASTVLVASSLATKALMTG